MDEDTASMPPEERESWGSEAGFADGSVNWYERPRCSPTGDECHMDRAPVSVISPR